MLKRIESVNFATDQLDNVCEERVLKEFFNKLGIKEHCETSNDVDNLTKTFTKHFYLKKDPKKGFRFLPKNTRAKEDTASSTENLTRDDLRIQLVTYLQVIEEVENILKKTETKKSKEEDCLKDRPSSKNAPTTFSSLKRDLQREISIKKKRIREECLLQFRDHIYKSLDKSLNSLTDMNKAFEKTIRQNKRQ